MWVDAQIGIGQMMRGRAMSQSIWRLRMNLALEPSKALALPATEPHLRSFKTPRLWPFVLATVRSPSSGG